ncbi:FUSC family protein [Cupriavidus plantarum]|uniref:Putative membrane protein YccC n=1 Tax=Cupriavidus plantarum TaxID=942865 RepID=A0A316ESD4_9BURK|nr:FUSC family protein [Cupriavidus plantarum]PWK35121.1 putative membrane protein YccC [Cupriavidus plantarum]
MPNWPSARDWLFSVKAFIASMLALWIALYMGLPRPYWAMATVYVVAHPLTGATRSKALYRVLGTLIGAAASVAFVPMLVNAPPLLMAVVALWAGALLYIALMDRTPRSYVFMLAAYTLALIALPAVDNPSGIFDVAIARSEEICIGIVCASVVGAVLFPTSVTAVLGDRTRKWMADATVWATDMLSANPQARATRHQSRHKLAADILALDQLISQLSYDTDTAGRVRAARELRGRMTMLLPVLSSLAAIVESMQAHRGVPEALAARMREVSDWIHAGAPAPAPVIGDLSGERRAGSGAAMATAIPADPTTPTTTGPQPASAPDAVDPRDADNWDTAMLTAATDRLQQMVALWQDCVSLCTAICRRDTGAYEPMAGWVPAFRRWEVGGARHYDHGMLLFSTGTIALGIFVMGMIWIWSGWADGAGAVALGAVACCFFAAADEPAPMIQTFFNANVVAVVMAMVLLFAVLPIAQNYELLVISFAIPFLGIGLLIAQPRFAPIGLALGVVTATDIGVQGAYSANFTSFFNGNIAGIAGILFALLWTLTVRPFGTQAAVRRLMRASWRDIADHANDGDPRQHTQRHTEFRARMLDRVSQLVPRLAASASEVSSDGFNEVRVELSTLALQRELPNLGPRQQHAVRRVLRSVAGYYEARLKGKLEAPPPALCTRLSRAQSLVRSPVALSALVEMHVSMFPPAVLPAPIPAKP